LLCIDVGTIVISFCFPNLYRRKEEDEHREREEEEEGRKFNSFFSLILSGKSSNLIGSIKSQLFPVHIDHQ
jgi:hypothetical protein